MTRFYPLVVLLLATAVLAGSAGAQQAVTPSVKPGASAPAAPENPANDPLFDVPPLPKGDVSLVGGTVTKIDRVRNKLSVRPFGGGSMGLVFDERTHIYRDGVETTQLGIRKGDRVYVDTMLDGPRVFARNIRVETNTSPADARGAVEYYDAGSGTMVVRDELTAQRVKFQVTPNTAIKRENHSIASGDLRPGTLVTVQFAPDRPNSGIAQEISVLATPGASYTFAGKITYLDVHLGMFAVENRTDNKTYELHFSAQRAAADKLSVGSEVTVSAVFDGAQYNATNIVVRSQ